MFKAKNHSFYVTVTRDRCHVEKKIPRKNCCVCFPRTSKGNGTVVGEVLQSRFSSFFANNVCIGDICAKNAGGRLIDKKKIGVGQLEFSFPLPFQDRSAVSSISLSLAVMILFFLSMIALVMLELSISNTGFNVETLDIGNTISNPVSFKLDRSILHYF